jgi:ABC-type transporter Mla subunit MlaD
LRYAGAQAGHVINIRLLNADERNADKASLGVANAARITVEVNNDVPAIPSDTFASINADTLLSEKFISLSAGSPIGTGPADKPVQELANNATLQGHPNGLDALLNGGGDLMPKLNGLLADVQANVVPNLNKTLSDADSLIKGDVKKAVDDADALVGDKSSLHATLDLAHDAVAKLPGVEDNLNGVLKEAGGLLGDVNIQLDGRLKQLKTLLDDVKVALAYVKSFTKQLAEKPNRVIFTTKTEKQPTEDEILKGQKPIPTPVPAPAQH